ncbi:hypothetical protein C2S52_017575 [Perilla frutescens var. hirtella]|uniref:Uncharacterized protein n=1 Tax=Perilla frutescens var. hirtella TaxID=608512 RepID=A0AAD4IY68_PERFH|nr:hypothetical protein C2S52_017575 [Perilla frutescens var. hirtella]KAH6811353.1 hypothetical protein C2S51_025115 [Perilla frutescens var. frutescens]KAH6823768.1 hypothetical protein C2S53_004504 [Perilla frutescens var. hirtella]
MDSHRTKRRSFSKSKLIKSLYRVAKPSATAAQPPYGSKPPKPTVANLSLAPAEIGVANQPTKPKPPPSPAGAGSAVGYFIVNQEQIFPQPTPKVAFVVAERNRDSYGLLENFYGAATEDDGVDAKAAKYISSVQERFRLERVNSERKNFQDILL